MNRDTTHVNGDSPHVNVESTHVSLPSLTTGRKIYALWFEWTNLSCELSQQLRSTHHCSAKKTSSFKECPISGFSLRDVQLAESHSTRLQADMDTPGQQDNVGQTGHVPAAVARNPCVACSFMLYPPLLWEVSVLPAPTWHSFYSARL